MMPWADAEIRSAFEALPDAVIDSRPKPWDAGETALLLYYWPIKRKRDVAKLLGRCEHACREQYERSIKET